MDFADSFDLVKRGYSSEKTLRGAGVVIYHLASSRVVLGWNGQKKRWFLPRGRCDIDEDIKQTATREGFEETGYACRLLPLPVIHNQTSRGGQLEASIPYCTEPIWTQTVPLMPGPKSINMQYFISWYVAETVTSEIAKELEDILAFKSGLLTSHLATLKFPLSNHTLAERIAGEGDYVPRAFSERGADEYETSFEASLVTVEEAIERLQWHEVMAEVVKRSWNLIQKRKRMEEDTVLHAQGKA